MSAIREVFAFIAPYSYVTSYSEERSLLGNLQNGAVFLFKFCDPPHGVCNTSDIPAVSAVKLCGLLPLRKVHR